MFGTKLRIRHSRPSVGYEYPSTELDVGGREAVRKETSALSTTTYCRTVFSRHGAAQPRLRITRRGQWALTALIAIPLVFTAFMLALNGGDAVATDSTGSQSFEHVTVQPGESLWQLAGQIAPKEDPRVVVQEIAQLNQLDNVALQPGQRIAVPKQYSH